MTLLSFDFGEEKISPISHFFLPAARSSSHLGYIRSQGPPFVQVLTKDAAETLSAKDDHVTKLHLKCVSFTISFISVIKFSVLFGYQQPNSDSTSLIPPGSCS